MPQRRDPPALQPLHIQTVASAIEVQPWSANITSALTLPPVSDGASAIRERHAPPSAPGTSISAARKDVLHQVRRQLGHPPAAAARTKAPPCTRTRRADPCLTPRNGTARSRRPDTRTGESRETPPPRTAGARRRRAGSQPPRGTSQDDPAQSDEGRWRWDRAARTRSRAGPRPTRRRVACHQTAPVNRPEIERRRRPTPDLANCGCHRRDGSWRL